MNLTINYITPAISCQKKQIAIFKTKNKCTSFAEINGLNAMKNSDLGAWNKFVFSTADKIAVIFKNHPAIISKITDLFAKIVRKTGSLSKLDTLL